MLDALPNALAGGRSAAVHRRVLNGGGIATAYLEAAVREHALNERLDRIDSQGLQEVRAVQGLRPSRTRHPEVARAGEDDVAVHDMVGDEGVHHTRSG